MVNVQFTFFLGSLHRYHVGSILGFSYFMGKLTFIVWCVLGADRYTRLAL